PAARTGPPGPGTLLPLGRGPALAGGMDDRPRPDSRPLAVPRPSPLDGGASAALALPSPDRYQSRIDPAARPADRRDLRSDFGARARGWLGALGELEALAALADLTHNEPEWTFPVVAPQETMSPALIEARRLGHPLLAGTARVPNDVTLGPPGTFLLVTGSNM